MRTPNQCLCRLGRQRTLGGPTGDVGLDDGAVVAQRLQQKQFLRKRLDRLHPKPHGVRRARVENDDVGIPAGLKGMGDAVKARLTSDVLVDNKIAIPAGTMVSGTVTDVISGSKKIGGIPTIGLRFERLELPEGDLPIDGVISQRGKSDTGRDTAKIVGGAAAGAILGHQVKGGDKGKVIGGLLGGAIGAVAAQNTGTEVQLAEGTALSIALAAPVDVRKP